MNLFVLLCALLACSDKPDNGGCGYWVGPGDGCTTCHTGIEQAHGPVQPGNCVICHGGDATALTQECAHVEIPENWAEVASIRGDDPTLAQQGYIKNMAPDQLAALDPDYVRFINPGDIRVNDDSCGQCHPDHTEKLRTSIMTTNAGHYMPTLFLAGYQDRDAIFGSHPAIDEECDPEDTGGTVCELETLAPPSDEAMQAAIDDGDVALIEEYAYAHYLSKSCNTCHAAGYPPQTSKFQYRSSGCTACHMIYGEDGVFEGGDEALPRNAFPFPKKHEITSAIPTEQCATCHFQGGRIGLLFRGIREGGFSEENTPPNAEFWNVPAYGHTSGYYILDEDTTNDYDETPPDVHYAAGMHCVDCHVGTDVHGTGELFSTSKQQVDLRCEDCHGTVRSPVVADASGLFRTQNGRILPQLSTGSQGEVILTGRVDGVEHEIPQPARMLANGTASDRMQEAMAPNGDDWTHAEALTCDTCHTSFNQYCIGCHVNVNMERSAVDAQTGALSHGQVSGKRDDYTLSHTLLGQRADGRIQRVIPSQQVQLTVEGYDSEKVLGEGQPLGKFRQTENSNANIGFHTFFQHTVTASPPECLTCHRTDDSEAEWARVKGVYGYGTGEFMLENPDGDPVDALQMIDEDGNNLTEWVHQGHGPVPADARERALSVEVDP
jgi:hypothetical protein